MISQLIGADRDNTELFRKALGNLRGLFPFQYIVLLCVEVQVMTSF